MEVSVRNSNKKTIFNSVNKTFNYYIRNLYEIQKNRARGNIKELLNRIISKHFKMNTLIKFFYSQIFHNILLDSVP